MPEETPRLDFGSLNRTAFWEQVQFAISIWKELQEQTDRGAGIIAAAVLEDQLGERLKLQFDASEHVKELYKNTALWTFDVKARLALAIGLIPENIFLDINRIRRIRNQFAHQPLVLDSERTYQPVTFESQSIRDLCMDLLLPDAVPPPDLVTAIMRHVRKEEPSEELPTLPPPSTPRARFIYTCTLLILILKVTPGVRAFLEDLRDGRVDQRL